tara:strand:- start:921 stop:1433 length:513 start_codon:yes stop_codon:yes gene_type:complete
MNYSLFLLFNKTIIIGFGLDITSNTYICNNDFFKQFTIWNIISMWLDCYNKQVIMNNITICVMFHSMFLLDPKLIYKIPKRCGVSLGYFGIINIILHIIPFMYSVVYLKNNIVTINDLDIFNNLVYLLIWSVYVGFDYSIYSIDKCYYKYLFLVYFGCLGWYKNDFTYLK